MKTTISTTTVGALILLAMLFFSPLSRAASFLELSDIENVSVVHECCSCLYARCFRFNSASGGEPYWGHVFDRENIFYDKQSGFGPVRLQSCRYPYCIALNSGRRCGAAQPPLESFFGCECKAQTGDNLLITYDGGQKKHIYLPPLNAFTELYVGSDGSTYYDAWLTQTAQEALLPSPSPTPTCMCWHTPSPAPTTTPTPKGFCTPSPVPICYCCETVYPSTISLDAQNPSDSVSYDSTYECVPDPAHLLDWWTNETGWIVVTPAQGFGIDGQIFTIEIALGDTSSLSPGWHRQDIHFHDGCDTAVVVDYYREYPSPTPSISITPPATPSPIASPTQTPGSFFKISGLAQDGAGAGIEYVAMHLGGDHSGGAFTNSSGYYEINGLLYQRNLSVTPEKSGWVFIPPSASVDGIVSDLEWNWSGRLITPTPTPINPVPTPTATLSLLTSVIDSGDYNGDGTSDVALFRPSIGLWAIRDITRTYFGTSGDLPVSGDFRGDGTTDIAYFRPSIGFWYALDVGVEYFGQPGDIPLVGDFDGDENCDIATFRGSSGLWSIYRLTQIYFGASNDCPVPGDYDGNDTTDIAVFRPSTSMWSVMNVTRFYLGSNTDRPVAGDFSGTGQWEGGIFRPSSGMWSIRNVTREYLGICTDWARPGDYNGDGVDDLGIFRDYSGLWAVRELTRVYFGATGDIPVTR